MISATASMNHHQPDVYWFCWFWSQSHVNPEPKLWTNRFVKFAMVFSFQLSSKVPYADSKRVTQLDKYYQNTIKIVIHVFFRDVKKNRKTIKKPQIRRLFGSADRRSVVSTTGASEARWWSLCGPWFARGWRRESCRCRSAVPFKSRFFHVFCWIRSIEKAKSCPLQLTSSFLLGTP